MDHIVRLCSGNTDRRTQAFFTFSLACFTGALFDKYGHKVLIAAGTFFLVLGFCMLSLCTKYYQFFLVHATLLAWGCNLMYVKRTIVGLYLSTGSSAPWECSDNGLTNVAAWHCGLERDVADSSGIMSSGSSLGSVTWPLVLANLPNKSEHHMWKELIVVGFGWTCRVMALIAAIAGVTAYFLLKTRLPPKPAGSFFYFEAFKDFQYICVCVIYWVSS